MKILYKLQLIVLVFLLFSSCSKHFLDEDTSGFLSPGNTFVSTAGFNAGLTGLYAFARLEFQTWNNDVFSQGATPQEALQVGTDMVAIKTTGTDATLAPFSNYTLNPASSYVRNYWKFSYGLIGNANQLLAALDNPEISWKDPVNDPKTVKGTATFFRAYAYRYLVTLYGDVPWVDKIAAKPRTDFLRDKKADIIQMMINDYRTAADNLPDNPDQLADGKLTKWAALHFLAEAYLMAQKPDSAIIAANAVINSGYFHLNHQRFGAQKDQPGDYFHDMFIENNQNRKSGNQETIWAIQLEFNNLGGGDIYTDWSKRAWVPFYAQQAGFILADSLGGRGLGQIRPFKWWLDFYGANDIRNSKYNIKRDWYYNDPKSPNYGKLLVLTDAIRASGNVFETTTKFCYGKTDIDPAFAGNMKDRVKARLAETYLLLAEAYIQKNDGIQAANAINIVRARAQATPLVTATLDDLLDERAAELIGEEMRRMTLSRFEFFKPGTFLNRTKRLNTQSKDVIKDYNVLWPVPQEVIDANTGAPFAQNQGY